MRKVYTQKSHDLTNKRFFFVFHILNRLHLLKKKINRFKQAILIVTVDSSIKTY